MTDAEKILRNLLKKLFISYTDDLTIKALTNDGSNYTSGLYTFEIADNCLYLKLFGKVAIVSESLREAMNAEHLYSTEQYIYTELKNIFNELEEKHNVAPEYRFKFPKFYGCNPNLGEETIILEDLTETGYRMYNKFDSVDWEHASIAVTTMAQFHAVSFVFEKEDPEKYKKVVEKLKIKKNEVKQEKLLTLKKIYDNAINIVENEVYRDRVKVFLEADKQQNSYMQMKIPIKVPVLVHGDFRTSNLMFRRVNGALETIVVDYQTVHTGSPVSDLLYFVFLGTDEQFRRSHYENLLDHYYIQLTLALKRMKINVNDVYSRETFDYEIKEMLPNMLGVSAMILPLVTVDAENAPLVQDADVDSFAIKLNDIFVERFNGLVRDCVKWKII